MTLLQHHILALSLTAITSLALGLFVLLAEPKRRLNQAFGLFSLAVAWWAGLEAFVFGAPDQRAANLWSYIEWPGVILIPPTFLHMVQLAIGEKGTKRKVMVGVAYASSFAFVLAHLFTDLITAPPRPVGYLQFGNKVTAFGSLIAVQFTAVVSFALWSLWQAYHRAPGQRKSQLKYLLWSSLIGFLGGSPNWFLSFGFYVPFVNPFGIYGVPIYAFMLAYAVLQYSLFDIKVVVRRSLVYSLLVTILTVGYFGLVYAVEWLFRTTFGYQSVWLSLTAFALMALAFQPLKIGIQQIVDRLFFRAPHEELARRMERLEQEVQHAEKLKAISTLAAGMAHEIKNPLTSIKTFASYLPQHGSDPAFQEKFQRIVTHEVDKIDHIVRRLLDFARPAALQLEPIKISQVLDETLELLSNEAVKRRVQVMRAYTPEDAIPVDPQQLRQVFLNLFLNSLEAMTPPPARLAGGPAPDGAAPPLAEAAGGGVNGTGGRLVVSTARQPDCLTVTIRDTGCGIPKEQASHLFEPFFTTKPTGSGLGLSVAHTIIKEHRGTIRIASHPGAGTTVKITLPLG